MILQIPGVLDRLRMFIRIGVGGRIILDHAGELMCIFQCPRFCGGITDRLFTFSGFTGPPGSADFIQMRNAFFYRRILCHTAFPYSPQIMSPDRCKCSGKWSVQAVSDRLFSCRSCIIEVHRSPGLHPPYNSRIARICEKSSGLSTTRRHSFSLARDSPS